MKLFHAQNIRWDCSNDDDPDQSAETLGLPNEVFVSAEDEDAVADALSDRYGWCVDSLDVCESESPLVLVAA